MECFYNQLHKLLVVEESFLKMIEAACAGEIHTFLQRYTIFLSVR